MCVQLRLLVHCSLILLCCFIPKFAGASPVQINIDANGNPHAINPMIYGVNCYANTSNDIDSGLTGILMDLHCPLVRNGGDATSCYNWNLNASNRGSDWYFESIGYPSSTAGEHGDTVISESQAGGAEAMLTVPAVGWVATLGADRSTLWSFSVKKYGAQTSVDPYTPDAGNGILASNGSDIQNAPGDASVTADPAFQQPWVQHLVSQWGQAANGGLKYYIIDNEPSLWNSTHRDVHPDSVPMAEVGSKLNDYATMIKSVDPSALVVGPEEWGWWACLYSGYDQQWSSNNPGQYPDQQSHGNMYYLPWLLQQMQQSSEAAGKRLLDVVSVHYYPQGGEYSDDTTTATELLRNRSTRSLWDPTYVDESWQQYLAINTVALIPHLKSWVNTYYPGTLTAITEYNWGAEDNINGATTQADIYGIFGREGLDMATRWTIPDPTTPTYNAMKMYRNYDGNRSAFGETSVSVTVPDPDELSAFAAVRGSDQALTVMVINKDLTNSAPVAINLANFTALGSAHLWQLTAANTITQLADLQVTGNTLAATLPAQSITLFVIPQGSAPLTSVALTPSLAAPQQIDTPITLTAAATGGIQLTFQFRLYTPATSAWSLLQDFSSSDTCDWTPTTAGNDQLAVTARDGVSGDEVTTTIAYFVTGAGPGDWWMFHHDLQHTGRSPFIGPASPTQKWTFPTGNSIASSAAIGSAGTIYVGSNDNNLYAINPDGTQKWAFLTPNSIIDSSPAIGADGTIYVGSNDHSFHAINPDGTSKWAFPSGFSFESSPAIGADGTIYVGSDTDNLYAFNPDGTVKWTYSPANGQAITSAPALGTDGTIYVGSYDSHLYAINPDGTQKWAFLSGNSISSSPAIGADGTIYVGSQDNNLYAITPAGMKKWAFLTGSLVLSSPAIGADGTIYVGSVDGNLYAINPDGTQKWAFSIGASIGSSPAIGADGTIYVGAGDNNLHAINPDGTQLWAFPTYAVIGSSPAIGVDGTIYVGSNDTNFYAIGPGPIMTFTITPGSGPNGVISPNSTQTVTAGDSLIFTATPNSGYIVNTWSVDGTEAQIGGTTFVLYDIAANHTVQVTFTPAILSAVSLTASPASPQVMHTDITLTATPTGGGSQVQYLFRVGYTDAAGWHWSNLTASYTATATCNWTPAAAGTFTLVVWARIIGHAASYDQYAAIPYQVTVPLLTMVALSAAPTSPQPVNTAITLTAASTGGGGQVQYLFRAGHTDAAGWHWTNLTANYTTTASCNWKPATAGNFTLVVWARIIGHTAGYDKYALISYQVIIPPLSAVALGTVPTSPQPVNTAITLTATPTGGGGQVQYLFRAGFTDAAGWHWTNINGTYSTTASCTWTPAKATSYTLVVWARLIGHTTNYDKYASSVYQVISPPLTAVALAANPTAPQQKGTPITLTATPTGGGGQVQYLFRAGYTDAAGWHWTNVNGTYTTTATCTWTSATVATYTLVVWARIIGHTANYDAYNTLPYKITQP